MPKLPIPQIGNLEKTQEVIRAFLQKYRFLHEWRLQKLIFYADLLSLSRRGKRITDVPYQRFHHGVYSENVKLALQQMDEVARIPDTTPDGKETVAFTLPKTSRAPKLPREDLDLINEAHLATRSITNTDLAEWGKETSLWRGAKHGDVLDFEKYGSIIERDGLDDIKRYAKLKQDNMGKTARFSSIDALLASLA